MSKEVVVKSEAKISRHCELNRFVDRVSTRLKHSSGLAIHDDIDIFAIPSNQPENNAFIQKPVHKSKYYQQVEEEYYRKRNPDRTQFEINREARRKVEQEQLEKVHRYREALKFKNAFAHLYIDVVSFSIDPDFRRMAAFRHLAIVGSLPTDFKFDN